MKYGPNTAAVEGLLKQAREMTREQAEVIGATWSAVRVAARAAARAAARVAAQEAFRVAVRDAAWVAAQDAAWYAAWDTAQDAAWNAAQDAAVALVVRDKISEEHFDVLYGPWASVFGETK